MKFLLLFGPIIRSIIKNYSIYIEKDPMTEKILQKFKDGLFLTPSESKQFGKVLFDIKTYLINKNIESRILPLKTYIGTGTQNWKGVINLLVEAGYEIYVGAYYPDAIKTMKNELEKISGKDIESIRIIAPLNMYDIKEIAKFFHSNLQLPVYPLNFNALTSKWILHLTFAPHTPRAFYFPEDTNAMDYIDKIKEIAARDKIKYLFLKDEFDSDNSGLVPYLIAPIETVDQFTASFYERIKGISNFGGLLMEEYLATNDQINVNIAYFFKSMFPKCAIYVKNTLKSIKEGCIFKNMQIDSKEEIMELPAELLDKFNPAIKEFYPYLLSSIEYIWGNNKYNIIDINSTANIWDFSLKIIKFDLNNLFLKFITLISQEPNKDALERQQTNMNKIESLYASITSLGPAYVNGDKIYFFKDNKTYEIKDILKDPLPTTPSTPATPATPSTNNGETKQ